VPCTDSLSTFSTICLAVNNSFSCAAVIVLLKRALCWKLNIMCTAQPLIMPVAKGYWILCLLSLPYMFRFAVPFFTVAGKGINLH
jgi:hypothetical protein